MRSLFRTGTPASAFALVGLTSMLGGCATTPEATHVFVRDPHQVWVEAASSSGEEVILPPGATRGGVRFRDRTSNVASATPYATLFREPSGGITLDDAICAPWPTAPLNAAGELKVWKLHGEAPFLSDGTTVRIPYLCEGRDHTRVQLDFVTPWANVREVRIVTGEVEPVAQGSSHPALQHRDWEPLPQD
jgi:hypothetical protein